MLPVVFPKTPLEFATLYLPVTVSSPATGEVKLVVHKYLSSEGKEAIAVKGHPIGKLLGFYEMAGAKQEHGVRRVGGQEYVVDIPPLDLAQMDIRYAVKQCHMGKGNPTHLRVFALLYTYWDQITRTRTGGYKPSAHWAGVQQYADEHIGVDCNGFVGAYFQCCHPAAGLAPHSDIQVGAKVVTSGGNPKVTGHSFAVGATVRTGLDQLRPGDVFLYNHRHIALLGDCLHPGLFLYEDEKKGKTTVSNPTSEFRVYQARGKKVGGVQGGVYAIKHTGGHSFQIRDLYGKGESWADLKAIVRPAGVPEWS